MKTIEAVLRIIKSSTTDNFTFDQLWNCEEEIAKACPQITLQKRYVSRAIDRLINYGFIIRLEDVTFSKLKRMSQFELSDLRPMKESVNHLFIDLEKKNPTFRYKPKRLSEDHKAKISDSIRKKRVAYERI